MHRPHTPTPARSLLVRIGMLAGLALASLSLSGCIVYAPPYHHYRGYY